ncbi:MAG TPA: hypothetical protein VGB74_06975 [Actinoplanes sp.]
MSRTSARRELAFVLGVAAAGLLLVLVVAFVPWYSSGPGDKSEVTRPEKQLTQLIDGADPRVALTPLLPDSLTPLLPYSLTH